MTYNVSAVLKSNLEAHTREGQKVPATIFFLFTWVHLFKGGSVYIKYFKPIVTKVMKIYKGFALGIT